MAESAVVACPDEVIFTIKQLEHSGSLVDPIKKSHNYSNFFGSNPGLSEMVYKSTKYKAKVSIIFN